MEGEYIYIEGIENIDEEFVNKYRKNAVYFTEAYVFPDEFSNINGIAKIYLAFFISKYECEYIKKYGCEKFEDYLEKNMVDIMELDR